MSIKLLHNITEWEDLKMNYWGIPKCANTSMKYALFEKIGSKLNNVVENDANAWLHEENRIKYLTPEQALSNGYYNFTIVRNPYDRVKALFLDFYGTRRGLLGGELYTNIHDFVEQRLMKEGDVVQTNVHLRSQAYFICPNDVNRMDFVADIDNLQNDISEMAMHCGINFTIPSINMSMGNVHLPDETKELVYERYKKDFDLIGFDKDTGKYIGTK